ncbi:hypothetical protein POVCU2_0038750 [Plasmodium ovale curtisi]|uniref:Uncharacterized protein n=1 Tax=Plasmodium ovale curtisi TaxID=864141 RepID=A0A1A8WVW0_PLAOA|nr:hypothetical protein POVCU2_0038750 [Plasmodium ovale curtisi]SBS97107.1 hypothetical protein POVCU1_035780 [Plasmodium ovale curtisi]
MKNCLKYLSTVGSIDQLTSKISRNEWQREFLLIYKSSCLNGEKRVKSYPGEALQTCHTQCISPDTEPLRAFKSALGTMRREPPSWIKTLSERKHHYSEKSGKTVSNFFLLNVISFANKTKGEGAKWMKVMGKKGWFYKFWLPWVDKQCGDPLQG